MEHVKEVRFGSFENLKTYINDVKCTSLDGKYLTSNFNRVIVNRNETKEIYIRGIS